MTPLPTQKTAWWAPLLRWALLLGTLLMLAVVLLDWHGQYRWKQAVEQLQREGETLDLQALLPAPVPEDRNYAAQEALRDITLVVEGDPKKGVPAERREALHQLAAIPQERFGLARPNGRLPDWSDVLRQLNAAARGQTMPPNEQAKAVCQELEARAPLLKGLADAAAGRTDWVAELLPPLMQRGGSGLLLTQPSPHLAALTQAVEALAVHGAAAADAGQASAAWHDLQAMLLIRQATQREAMLLAHVTALAMEQACLNLTWYLLRQRCLDDAALQALQTHFAEGALESAYLQALRTEMVAGVQMLDQAAESLSPVLPGRAFHYVLGRRMLAMNKAAMVHRNLEHCLLPLKSGGFRALFLAVTQADDKKPRELFSWDDLFARMTLGTLKVISVQTVRMETCRRQASLAIAVERYYLRHQIYPEKLEALVPEFMVRLPLSPVSEEPISYRGDGHGRYVLEAPDGEPEESLCRWSFTSTRVGKPADDVERPR